MKLLVSAIENPFDVMHEGEFFAVPLEDYVVQKIAKLHGIATSTNVYNVEDFCGDILYVITREDYKELVKDLEVPKWDFSDYVIVEHPDEPQIPDRERVDCVTLNVGKDGAFMFQCYLMHGGSETLETQRIPLSAALETATAGRGRDLGDPVHPPFMCPVCGSKNVWVDGIAPWEFETEKDGDVNLDSIEERRNVFFYQFLDAHCKECNHAGKAFEFDVESYYED